jgi:hypothetical protein
MAQVKDIDRGMNGITKLVAKLRDTALDVGVFSDAINTETTSYVAEYAIVNEYGSGHIPERSFMRRAVDEKGEEWNKNMADMFMHLAEKGGNVDKELYKIGAQARDDIVDKICSNINPPNATATIAKKGPLKNRTLIDDGFLRRSIEARISKK